MGKVCAPRQHKTRLEQDVKDPPTTRVVRVLFLCVSQLSNSFVQRALNDAFVSHETRGWCRLAICTCRDSFPCVSELSNSCSARADRCLCVFKRLVVGVSWRFVRAATRFRVYLSCPTVVQRALNDAFVSHTLAVFHLYCCVFYVDLVDIPVRCFTLTILLLQSGLRLDPYPQRSFHTIGASH